MGAELGILEELATSEAELESADEFGVFFESVMDLGELFYLALFDLADGESTGGSSHRKPQLIPFRSQTTHSTHLPIHKLFQMRRLISLQQR